MTATRPNTGEPSALRDHLSELRQRGGTYRTIAAAAAVAPTTVHALAVGRRDGTGSIARALLAVTSDALPQGRLDAGGTRLRLRALHVMGHSSARIARATGASDKTIRKLVRGDAKTISPQLHDAIADVYDAWWDKRAPARTRAERTAATTARRRAIAGNWCAGADLDDDQLDTPATAPRATGNPPPAPAPPPTSTHPGDTERTDAHEQRRPTMSLTIDDGTISSDHTSHTAHLAPGHEHTWQVSWLPGRLLDRNSAITAMVLADAAGEAHPGHQLWPFVEGWAAELGLSATDALARASDRASLEKDAIPEDPEAASL